MTKKIEIEDDFYVNYSFINDFSYTKEDEIDNIKELLISNGIEPSNENIIKTLTYIRDISLLISNNYKNTLNRYIKWRKFHKYIGGDEPAEIGLAKRVFNKIVSLGSYIKDILTGKSEDEKYVDEILKKMEKDHKSIVLEIKKTYKIKSE